MIALPPQDTGRNWRIQILLLVMALMLNGASVITMRAVLVSSPVQETHSAFPLHVRITSINVDAPIVMLGLRNDGTMDIPKTAYEVGWFSPGFIPGQQG